MYLVAIIANATYHHISSFCIKAFWQLYFRHNYMIQAISGIAIITYKMYVVIMVMALRAFIFAQGIQNRVV